MRPLLRPSILLLLAAILLVIGLFWARSRTGEKAQQDPLLEAQQQVERVFGMKLATVAGPQGGLKVEAVGKGRPADLSGIKVGDRVLSVGDRSVWHVHQLSEYVTELLQSSPGISLLVSRDTDYFQVIFGRPGSHVGAPGQGPPGAGRRPGAAPGRMPGGMPPGAPEEAGP